ncbi:MAG: hypothetical protein AAF531_11950 [Actinomycetota bacterium]
MANEVGTAKIRCCDYMLILGGLATGMEPRVKYAAELINNGLTIREQVAGLGSFRELQDKELPISREYAPRAATRSIISSP